MLRRYWNFDFHCRALYYKSIKLITIVFHEYAWSLALQKGEVNGGEKSDIKFNNRRERTKLDTRIKRNNNTIELGMYVSRVKSISSETDVNTTPRDA